MFEKYNKIQKYAYLIALIFFIVGNLFALLLLLLFSSRPSEANFSFANLQNLNGNQSVFRDIQIGERISISSGYTYLENESVDIFSNSSSSMFFIDQKTINIEKGVFLIYSKSDIKISFRGNELLVNKQSTVLFDEVEERFIVLEGQIKNGDILVENNKYFNFNDPKEVKDFQRSDLAELNRFVQLNIVLSTFSREVEAFTDLIPPSIISISPVNGSKLDTGKIRIIGMTEVGSKISFNDSLVSIDSFGNFAFFVDLEEGENFLKLELEDKYGNSSSYSLTYFLESSSSIPEI